MFIGIGLGLIPQAMTGSSVDALLGGNSLDNYGNAAFLFDVPLSTYRNGTSQVGSFGSLTGLTFTRALAAYAPNSAGVLQLFASGVPRITDKGLLIEGARTNLELRSQEFDNAAWTKTDITVSADNAAAPDGTTTADLITEGSAGTALMRSASAVTVVAGSTYTTTRFVKRSANLQWIRLAVGNDTSFTNAARAWFDIQNGVKGTLSGTTWTAISSEIEAVGSYYRIRITYSVDVNTTLYVAVLSASADNSATRVSGAAYWLWGAQSELGAFPSSYIPTTSASVTRPADVCSIAVSGISYPATLFAEFERVVDTGGYENQITLNDGSANNRAELYVDSSDRGGCEMRSGGVNQGGPAVTGALSVGVVYRLAARFNTNSIQVARSGTLGTEDTSATLPSAPTTVLLGAGSGGGSVSFGFIKRAAIWNSAFTDSQLTGVTS